MDDSGRNDQHGGRLGARAESRRQGGPEMAEEPGAPELCFPRAHVHVPHLEHGQAVPRRPRLRTRVEEPELDRQDPRRRQEGVDPRRVGIEHRPRLGVLRLVVRARARADPQPAGSDILPEGSRAGPFRPSPPRAAPVELHVPQPVLGVHEPLGEERVGGPRRHDVGDAPFHRGRGGPTSGPLGSDPPRARGGGGRASPQQRSMASRACPGPVCWPIPGGTPRTHPEQAPDLQPAAHAGTACAARAWACWGERRTRGASV